MANVPNLQYVIEMLAMSQIYDVVIATKSCNSHREKIIEFTKLQAFKERGIKIKLVGLTAEAVNVGDVLRQVAENKIFKDDFVVVRGDTVSNLDIRPAIKAHYHIKEQQSKAINKAMIPEYRKFKTVLTKVFIKSPHNDPLRDPSSDISLLLDE